jgi:hypothetical protein
MKPMAKLSSKKKGKKKGKKNDEKKKSSKKKLLILKGEKKKGAKKKDAEAKKKQAKKKDKKKQAKKKAEKQKVLKKMPQPAKAETANTMETRAAEVQSPREKVSDHSSRHNVREAVRILRSLESYDEVLAFTKGEKRVTVTRAIPVAKRALASL